MKRCVHLIPETLQAGAELQALALLEGLRERTALDLEIVYFAAGRLHDRFARLGIPMHRVERRRRLLFDFPSRVKRLRAIYEPEAPALLHTWLFEGNVIGLAAARVWPQTRAVVTQRSGTAERELPPWQRGLMQALYPRADRALANSQDGLYFLRELGVPDTSLRWVPQGVPTERTEIHRLPGEIRRALGVASDEPLIVSVGRADHTKDFGTLIEAMKRVRATKPDARLAVVGPVREQLNALGLRLDHGMVAIGWDEHPADVLNAADVVAIASWTEGNSNVANEALALGKPVACTDTGDHPVIVRRAGGRVVPIRSPEPLGDAIVYLLENPPAPDSVRAVATADLGVSAGLEATIAIYEDLLGGALCVA